MMAKGGRIPLAGLVERALQADPEFNDKPGLQRVIASHTATVMAVLEPLENEIVTPADLLAAKAAMMRALADPLSATLDRIAGVRGSAVKQLILREADLVDSWADGVRTRFMQIDYAFRLARLKPTSEMLRRMVDGELTYRALFLDQPSVFFVDPPSEIG